jgi:uncharacterized protein
MPLMKKLLLIFLLVAPFAVFAQKKSAKKKHKDKTEETSASTTADKFEPISLFFVMLVKGPNREQDSATAEKIQEGHLANITKLSKSGKLLVAGPFMEDLNWRGIFILKCDTQAEAEKLIKTDPAIISGRLTYEIHPWMTGKNCLFK